MDTTKHGTGCIPSPLDPRDFAPKAATPDEVASLPARFDVGHQMPVINQGGEGSCVGCSGAGLLGFFENLLGFKRTRSARDVYELARETEPVNGEGAFIRAALKAMQKRGACEEATRPYREHWPAPAGPTAEAERSCCRVKSYLAVATNTVDMKVAMKRYGAPLYVMVYVDATFYGAKPGVTIAGPGREGGGHAILIIGWDDSRRAWRVRNSWGTGWGEGGYAWLSFDYRIQEAWAATPDLSAAPPPPAPRPWWAFLFPWFS